MTYPFIFPQRSFKPPSKTSSLVISYRTSLSFEFFCSNTFRTPLYSYIFPFFHVSHPFHSTQALLLDLRLCNYIIEKRRQHANKIMDNLCRKNSNMYWKSWQKAVWTLLWKMRDLVMNYLDEDHLRVLILFINSKAIVVSFDKNDCERNFGMLFYLLLKKKLWFLIFLSNNIKVEQC